MSGKKKGGGLEDPIEHRSSNAVNMGDSDMGFTMGSEEDWDDIDDATYASDEIETVDTHPPANAEEAELLRLEQEAEEAKAKEEEDGDSDETEGNEPETGDEDIESDEDESETDEDSDESDEGVDEVDESDEDGYDSDTSEGDEPQIPKHRFDEVNQKRKEAEEELRRLKAEQMTLPSEPEEPEPLQPPVDEFDYDDAEDRYQDAVLEGRKDDAKGIRKEMREAELSHAKNVSRFEAEQVTGQNNVSNIIAQTARTIEAAHPEFQANNESFNPEITSEALELSEAYLAMPKYKGNPTQALIDAAEHTLKIYGVLNKDGDRFDASDVEETSRDSLKARKETKARKEVKRKQKVAGDQPPKLARKQGGTEEPSIDVQNMSEEEWDALPESTKARLRGDFV